MNMRNRVDDVLAYIEYICGGEEEAGEMFSNWSDVDVATIIFQSVLLAPHSSYRMIAIGLVGAAMYVRKSKAS